MPLARHSTAYIHLDTRQCNACWDCIAACPNGVLGKIKMLFHKHARIEHADRCGGCGTCISVCPSQAITFIQE